MTDRTKLFMEKISADDALQAELAAALKDVENAEQVEVMIRFAREKGWELTKEDLAQEEGDISVDDLDTVIGGGGCGCCLGGYGSGDGIKCACAICGMGIISGESASQGGCYCVGSGAGATNRH